MNNCVISGRLTNDVDLKYASGTGLAIARCTVAAQRKYKDKKTGKYESDFINCLAFDKRAEIIAQHFFKGDQVLFSGSWQTGSYPKDDGTKVYTNELLIENFDFIGNKKDNAAPSQPVNNGGMTFDDDLGEPIDDGDMPF